jgi:hypothetical protein
MCKHPCSGAMLGLREVQGLGSHLTSCAHLCPPRPKTLLCIVQAFVVVGDSNGHVGLGVKCAKEVCPPDSSFCSLYVRTLL